MSISGSLEPNTIPEVSVREPLMRPNIKNLEDDIESQAELNVRKKKLPFCVQPELLASMNKMYNLQFECSIEKRQNLHPYLAYERNTLLHRLCSNLTKAGKIICDVGGSPKRLKYFNTGVNRIIHLCPQLQPGDHRRFSGGHLLTTCHHTLEQHLVNIKSHLPPHPPEDGYVCCSHPRIGYNDCHVCKVVDTYVFCHSAYYITPTVLADAIDMAKDKTIYVIGHLFDPVDTTHHWYDGQAKYTYDSEGNVVFSAAGNSHMYVHPVLPWNDSPIFSIGDIVYEATILRTLGKTHLWMVTKTCYPVNKKPPIVLDWQSLVLDTKQKGEIQTTLDPRLVNNYVNVRHTINLNRFIGAGPYLIALNDTAQIRVPRGAISAVSEALVGKERNPVTFSLATAVARGYISRSQLPIEERPTAIIAATVIGFSLHLPFETNMIDTARYRFSGWWSRHANSLKLGSLTALPLAFVSFLLFVVDSATIVIDQETHVKHHPIFLVGLVVNILLVMMYTIVYCLQRAQHQNLAASFGDLRINDGIGAVLNQTLNVPLLKVPASRNFAPLSDLEEGSVLVVGPEKKPPNHDKPTLFVAGPVNPFCMPVTAPSTQESEIVAITNRVLAVQPYRMTSDFKEDYDNVFAYHPSFQLLKHIRVRDTLRGVKTWLHRSKYNQQTRERFLELAKDIRSGVVEIVQTSLSHVKSDEKLLKTGLVNKQYSGRIVNAKHETHNVATGPFMWEWSNQLAAGWNGTDMIYYTRGASAEDIGRWFAIYLVLECGGKYDDIFAIEDDFEKYDSCIDSEHKEPVRKSWVDAGAHPSTIEAFSHEVTKGKTRHQVKYSAEMDELNSGENATNALGSVINAAVHVAAIEPVLHPSNTDRMAVMGDDNLILRNPRLLNNHMTVDEMTESLREGGMRPGILIRTHVAQVEFCSRIFLESARKPGVWVLSPKPGRVMSKMGWNFVRSGNTLYQDVLSMIKDSMHVPFLRHYVRRIKELAPPRKVKKTFINEWDIHATDYHDNKDGTLPQSTWDIVHARYGLTPEDEEAFGVYMNTITSLECVMSFPTLERLTQVDCP